MHSIGWIHIDDLTNFIACRGLDEAVGDETFSPEISVVDQAVLANECGDAVALFEGAEVDAFLRFSLVPKPVVNAGAIPEVENTLAFAGPLAKGFKLLTLEHFHVMLALFSVVGLGEIEVAEVMIAKVEVEEMSGR